jgi:hypothetical protein
MLRWWLPVGIETIFLVTSHLSITMSTRGCFFVANFLCISIFPSDPAKTSLTHTCCNDWTKNRALALVHWPEQRIEPSKKAVFSPTIR